MLDIKVYTFLEVCKTLNYTNAAKVLNITQPAVSKHISQLENHYGAKLFIIKNKKISLTNEGEKLKNLLNTIAIDETKIINSFKLKTSSKKIKFGVTLSVGGYMIPKQLANYNKRNPQNPIEMIVSNTKDLLYKIDNGNIDFAIIEGYFPKKQYEYCLYRNENYIGICGNKFQNKSLDFEELLNKTLILREKGSGTREILYRTLESNNLSITDFNNLIEISDMNAIKKLVAENCGISFMYEAAAIEEIQRGSLKKLEINNYNETHDINFVYRKNSYFKKELIDIFDELL